MWPMLPYTPPYVKSNHPYTHPIYSPCKHPQINPQSLDSAAAGNDQAPGHRCHLRLHTATIFVSTSTIAATVSAPPPIASRTRQSLASIAAVISVAVTSTWSQSSFSPPQSSRTCQPAISIASE